MKRFVALRRAHVTFHRLHYDVAQAAACRATVLQHGFTSDTETGGTS